MYNTALLLNNIIIQISKNKGGAAVLTQRASEILKSPDTIKVLYNNTPVWIDSIDETKQTAGIRLLETGNTLEVPVNELREAGRNNLF